MREKFSFGSMLERERERERERLNVLSRQVVN